MSQNQYINTILRQLEIKFSRTQGNIWASVGLDYGQEEAGRVGKETGRTVSRDPAGSGWPLGSLCAVTHLWAAVFLDPAGVRPVGDPNCLRSGEQREVERAGCRPGREKPRKQA